MSLYASLAAILAFLFLLYLLFVLAERRTRAHAPPTYNQPSTSFPSAVALVPEKRHFFLQVHGIYHRNSDGSSRQKIIRSCFPGEVLQLVPEPDNSHDPDAIKVCRSSGEQLGYLDASSAARFTSDMAIGWTFRVTAEEIFAADKPGMVGCKIRIAVLTMSYRTEARKRKKQQV